MNVQILLSKTYTHTNTDHCYIYPSVTQNEKQFESGNGGALELIGLGEDYHLSGKHAPFKEKEAPSTPEGKPNHVLLMTIASKRISKCNYVSSYETYMRSNAQTRHREYSVYAPKLV